MTSPTTLHPGREADLCEEDREIRPTANDPVLSPSNDRRAARGALTGIILSAGMWAAIYAAVAAFRH